MQAHRHGTPMLVSDGYVAVVDAELCASYCEFEALAISNGTAAVESAACMGCGVCVSKCPEGALSVQRAPDRGQPLEIQELIARAAQVTDR